MNYTVNFTRKNGVSETINLTAKNQGEALASILRSTSEDGIHPSVYRVSIKPARK